MKDKVERANGIIRRALEDYPNIALACSFGKDSMVVLHLALQLKRDIPVFTIMTPFKPNETFRYKERITRLWKLDLKEYIQEDNIEAEETKLWLRDP
jgi:phosphoadenosine phosphosulfate reductase